jgi:hypothetical protein
MNNSKQGILNLYKDILRNAKVFPSKNRTRIYNEIRTEFKKNRNLIDEVEIQKALSTAQKGLSQLSMYTKLPKRAGEWSVNMEQNPMPKPTPIEGNEAPAP